MFLQFSFQKNILRGCDIQRYSYFSNIDWDLVIKQSEKKMCRTSFVRMALNKYIRLKEDLMMKVEIKGCAMMVIFGS